MLQALCLEALGQQDLIRGPLCLFVFDLGGARVLRDTPPSLNYYSAIPPQDSPSGHSRLEPPWPLRHPFQAKLANASLEQKRKWRKSLLCLSVHRTKSQPDMFIWGCRRCHPGSQPLKLWSALDEVHPSGLTSLSSACRSPTFSHSK